MEKKTRDFLKLAVIAYANMPPKPIENLRYIENIILKSPFDNDFAAGEILKHYYDSHLRIGIMIKLTEIGYDAAKSLLSKQNAIVAFVKNINESDPHPYFNNEKQSYEFYVQAYNDLYRCCIGDCPCSHDRIEVLAEKGFVSIKYEPLNPAFPEVQKMTICEWIEGKSAVDLSCVECDHWHFVSIMESITKGECRHMDSIIISYQKTLSERVSLLEKQCFKKEKSIGYQNDDAFPKYLFNGLPCNALIDLLLSDPKEISRIKQCPFCNKFFFAQDAKRKICYDSTCENEYHRKDMQTRRGNDPVKYC